MAFQTRKEWRQRHGSEILLLSNKMVTSDLFPIFNQTDYPIFGRSFGHIVDLRVGPDGDLSISIIRSDIRESLEVFDGSEDDYIGSVYRVVKR